MRRAVEAVLFDFDGTLVPCLDLPALRRAVVALAGEHGVPSATLDGLYILEAVTAAGGWLQAHGGDAGTWQSAAETLIQDTELAAAAGTQPFPGVRELLGRLRARGTRIGVVTRNCEAAVRQMLHDVDVLTDAFVPRERAHRLKPDPEHLRQCLAMLDCVPRHAVMVGDGAMDMQVGRALDLFCVGVTSGVNDAAALTQAGAHAVLRNVIELDTTLSALATARSARARR